MRLTRSTDSRTPREGAAAGNRCESATLPDFVPPGRKQRSKPGRNADRTARNTGNEGFCPVENRVLNRAKAGGDFVRDRFRPGRNRVPLGKEDFISTGGTWQLTLTGV